MQSVNAENGGVASYKFNIPKDVTHAAPNWCLLNANGYILIPSLFTQNLDIYNKADMRKAGNFYAGWLRFLWSVSPFDFLIFIPFYLINYATYYTFFLSTSLTKIKAKSCPLSISTKQLILTELWGINYKINNK